MASENGSLATESTLRPNSSGAQRRMASENGSLVNSLRSVPPGQVLNAGWRLRMVHMAGLLPGEDSGGCSTPDGV